MDDSLKVKLEGIEKTLKELEVELSAGDLVKDQKLYAEKAKKHRELSDINVLFNEWKNLDKDIIEAKNIMEEEIDLEMKKELESLISESDSGRATRGAHRQRIARPGPGKGWRSIRSLGNPRTLPRIRTSSL